LVDAIRAMLVPLVRLLLSNGITQPFLASMLKRTYVGVAEREFAIKGRPQTTSRLSLLTGIHRKDVKRLREEPETAAGVPRTVSLGAQLVARWMAVDEFREGAGPRPLPRLAASDDGASFESLVESVSKDIRPRAILDEWIRLGVAHIDDDDCVCLNTGAFVPEKGFDEKAHYLGRSLRDHLAAAGRNLTGAATPLLERAVYYDELSDDSVDELAVLSRKLGEEALDRMNRRALALQQRDAADAKEARQRMSFGVYFYEEADAASSPDPGEDDA
jgi:hypothetical protein